MRWWRWFRVRQQPLRGAPTAPRVKTYSADTGFVYQYRFLGFRERRQDNQHALEYVFQITTGREPETSLSVVLSDPVLSVWAQEHKRELTASERFALAKMSLKRKLDEWEQPDHLPSEISPDPADLASISAELDL